MRTITQFKIYKNNDTYVAEGIDLAIVTEAKSLDELVKNINESVSLYFEGENVNDFDYSQKPSILINYEIPEYA